MKENKIALVLALVVISITLIIAIVYATSNKSDEAVLDVKVYKLFEKEDSETGHVYRECTVSKEKLEFIANEFNKSYKISKEKLLNGKQITGSYKIIYNDKFIAFDNAEDNMVYLSETKNLYEFKTELYSTIIDICG